MGGMSVLHDNIWFTDVALGEYDVRGVLIVGDTHVAVWDTLSHPGDMAPFLPLLGNRGLVIVYSHADWDHVWGTSGLPYEEAAILGHRACLERFSADVPRTLREKQEAEPGKWDSVRLIAPNRVFDRETVVDLGSITLSLHHLPGHTRDSIVGFIPERGVLLMGDAAETPFPVVPADSPMATWAAELERWERTSRVRTVVPAHGPIGDTAILRSNIDYLKGLLSGHPVTVSGPLTAFYRATHEANLRVRGLEP